MLCSIRFYIHKQVVNILTTIYTILKPPFYFSCVYWQELYRTPGLFVKYNHIAVQCNLYNKTYTVWPTAIQSRKYGINCLYNEISGIPLKKAIGHLCRCVSMCMRVGYTHKHICLLYHPLICRCSNAMSVLFSHSRIHKLLIAVYLHLLLRAFYSHWKCE